MKNLTKVSLLSLGLLLGGVMLTPTLAAAADFQDSKDATKLLLQIKRGALQLKQDAEMAESYTRSGVTREAHACAADQIREEIDAIAREVAKLDDATKGGLPWQKEAVEHLKPVAYELVANQTAVIDNLNKGGCLTSPDYTSYLHANVSLSDRLLATVKQYVDESKVK